MTTAKLIISSIVGASTLGGGAVGAYCLLKPKAPESSQSASNNPSSTTGQPPKPLDTTNRDTNVVVGEGADRVDPQAQVSAQPPSLPSAPASTGSPSPEPTPQAPTV